LLVPKANQSVLLHTIWSLKRLFKLNSVEVLV